MSYSLRERIEEYEDVYDYKATRRCPIIVRTTIRNYKRLSHELETPYCDELSEVMANTMLYAITNIQDAIFGFCFGDEINFVLRNDQKLNQEPWYNNNVQKMASITASMASIGFSKSMPLFGNGIPIVGDAIFDGKVFSLPYLGEAVNYLIWHQQTCLGKAIATAAQVGLEEKFKHRKAAKLLNNKTYGEKVDLLLNHCGIDFYDFYPVSFFRGVGAYKIPTITDSRDGEVEKNKWHLNYEIPNFVEDKEFISNILNNGRDVFRASSLNIKPD